MTEHNHFFDTVWQVGAKWQLHFDSITPKCRRCCVNITPIIDSANNCSINLLFYTNKWHHNFNSQHLIYYINTISTAQHLRRSTMDPCDVNIVDAAVVDDLDNGYDCCSEKRWIRLRNDLHFHCLCMSRVFCHLQMSRPPSSLAQVYIRPEIYPKELPQSSSTISVHPVAPQLLLFDYKK